jgi:hypothetical protein
MTILTDAPQTSIPQNIYFLRKLIGILKGESKKPFQQRIKGRIKKAL